MAERPSPATSRRHPAPPGAGCLAFCALLSALASPRAALADAPRGALEAGAALLRLDYREYGPTGVLLDRETGWLRGAGGALALEAGRWFGRWGARFAEGELRYEGLTQSANPALDLLPVASTSGARLYRLEGTVGRWLDARRRLAAYGGVAGSSWRRRIRSTTLVPEGGAPVRVEGLRERYEWAELHAGARWAALRTRRLEVALDARVLATIAGRVRVEVPGDDPRLALAPRPGLRAALEARHALAGGWYAALEAEGRVSAYGASDVDRRTGFHEPDSVTRAAGLEARLGASF